MKNKIVIIFGFVLMSCSSIVQKDVRTVDIDYLKAWTVADINLDYEIDCKVKIKTEKLTQSGKCGIIVSNDGELKFSLYHPLGGAIIISYMNKKKIQYLNREDKVFYQVENNDENRKMIFLEVAELGIADFKEILWGRKIIGLNNNLEFIQNGVKPTKAIKKSGEDEIEITYHKWSMNQGIQMPKLFTIRNLKTEAYIKIAVTKSQIGKIKKDKEMELLRNCQIEF